VFGDADGARYSHVHSLPSTPLTQRNAHCSHDFVRCDLPHLDLRRHGPQYTGAKRRKTMKTSKQIPLWLTIDVLISIVGLGLIALGIVTATARIFGTPVQEYARLIPF
jgi:hypothetical protein